jgi:hypothetical protein
VTNDPIEERIREVIIGEIEPQIIVRPPHVALSRESRPPGVAHGELDEALDPLVSTKLRPSQARPKLVARPRLVGRLDPEAGRRLTLVSAPAGFGKTTVLGKWVKDQMDKERPVAWLSLDEDDNDPARFLSYVVAAVGRATGESRIRLTGRPRPIDKRFLAHIRRTPAGDLLGSPGGPRSGTAARDPLLAGGRGSPHFGNRPGGGPGKPRLSRGDRGSHLRSERGHVPGWSHRGADAARIILQGAEEGHRDPRL